MTARLTTWYAVSAFALAMLSAAAIYAMIWTSINGNLDEGFTDVIEEVRRDIEKNGRVTLPLEGLLLHVTDERGGVIVDSGLPKEVVSRLRAAGDLPTVAEVPGLGSYRVATRTKAGRTYIVGFDRAPEFEFLASYRRVVAILVLPSLAAAVVVGALIVRRGLRPLSDMAETVASIGVGRLGDRVELSALPREVSELASSFNAMLDRLENAFQRLDRFSADIAHELRTPVHNLRNVAEVAISLDRSPGEYREALAACLDEAERLGTLIDRLLFLARAEDPRRGLNRETIDVGAELERVREFYGPAAEEAGVSLEVRAEGGLQERLDRPLFQRAVGNLLSNAIRHTPRGGHVAISAQSVPGGLEITVADDGCGIAPEHLPRIFDRFYRSDPARTPGEGGLGLGLAIARSIAELHGGHASVRSQVGQGTVASLFFANELCPPAR